MPANLENSSVTTGLKNVSFHPNPKERQCLRILVYHTIAIISQPSKVMLKILKPRLQIYVNPQMFKLDLEKAEEPEIKLPISVDSLEKETATHSSVLTWRIPGMGEPDGLPSLGSHRVGHDWSDLAAVNSSKKQKSSRKTSTSITTHCGKLFKRWKYQTT